MVVEGSRRSRLDGEVREGVKTASDEKARTSMDDAFTATCLAKLGLETTINGHANESNGKEAGLNNATTETDKLSNIHNQYRGKSIKELLCLISLARMLRDHPELKSQVIAFSMHSLLIDEIQVSGRRLELESDADVDPSIAAFTQAFASCAGDILTSSVWEQATSKIEDLGNIIDLVDGRLLHLVSQNQDVVYRALAANRSILLNLSDQFEWIRTLSATSLEGPKYAASSANRHKPQKVNNNSSTELAILPFSNSVFDKHLASIRISVAAARAPRLESARIFQEVSHWHNVKRRLDPKVAVTISDKQKFWALKRNQWFMAEMLSYAASLTNASGKVLEPETITVSDTKRIGPKMVDSEKENTPAVKPGKSQGGKGIPKGKVVGNKTVRESINATRAAKEEDNVEKTFKAWDTARKFIDSDALPRSRYTRARAYLIGLPENKQRQVRAEVEFYKLYALLEIYQKNASTEQLRKESANDDTVGVSAMLWDSIRKLASIPNLTKTIVDNAKQIVATLGLPEVDFPTPTSTRQLSFTPNMRITSLPKIPLASQPRNFQLLHCGPYMDRNLDSAPDPRVPFEPDGWQRQVLDELDADHSVFVVAPTSAGKTFISFYAMERILRSSDDGVLVYVAPTKALVNQIAAEIQVCSISTHSILSIFIGLLFKLVLYLER